MKAIYIWNFGSGNNLLKSTLSFKLHFHIVTFAFTILRYGWSVAYVITQCFDENLTVKLRWLFLEAYLGIGQISIIKHCVKSVQIRSFFWSVFSCIRTEYGEIDTPYLSVFSTNAGKYGPEKTPYLGTFHAVQLFANIVDG